MQRKGLLIHHDPAGLRGEGTPARAAEPPGRAKSQPRSSAGQKLKGKNFVTSRLGDLVVRFLETLLRRLPDCFKNHALFVLEYQLVVCILLQEYC
jgi:hypothetical protein